MSFWSRLRGLIVKDTSSDSPANWFVDWIHHGDPVASGVRVTPDSAMRSSAVWACVRLRSEDIAKLPLILYRRLPNGNKERATKHPLYALMHDQPNPRQSSFEFRQLLQAQVDLRGNGLARIERDLAGRVLSLWPLDPTRTKILRAPDGELFYDTTAMGGEVLPAEEVFHLRGFTLDGVTGLSPIAYHREAVGLAMAAQTYGAAFFGNNATPSGGVKVPGNALGKEAAQRLRDSWEARHQGVENGRKLAIFDGGMEWVNIGMDNVDAQYLETRKFQIAEIARIFRIPPHKIGDLEKATFSNIEQQALEYVSDALLTEARRWESTLALALLQPEEQGVYFFEFLFDALLRGDLLSRMQAYAVGRNWGILSADDCRAKENMNALPDGQGEIYLQPLNMIEAGTTPPVPAAPAAPAATPAIAPPADDTPPPAKARTPRKRAPAAQEI